MVDADVTIHVSSTDEARTLLGPLDTNARLLREVLGVNVLVRSGSFRLLGEDAHVATAQDVFESALADRRSGRSVDTAEVARRIRKAVGLDPHAAAPVGQDNAPQRSGPVKARTPGQQRYLDALEAHDVVFGVGPAGTGKTYLAVAAAIEAVRSGSARRIVLVRPAVEAGEKLGFLPGDYQAKVDPYLRPLYDAMQDLLDPRTRARYLEGDVIEVCPLAYMRGRTLNQAFVILDEAQNTTIPQMMMFLTRLGEESRMVVTGDPSQVDLPGGVQSGLADAVRRLRAIDEISVCVMQNEDVVRHGAVKKILEAYADRVASLD